MARVAPREHNLHKFLFFIFFLFIDSSIGCRFRIDLKENESELEIYKCTKSALEDDKRIYFSGTLLFEEIESKRNFKKIEKNTSYHDIKKQNNHLSFRSYLRQGKILFYKLSFLIQFWITLSFIWNIDLDKMPKINFNVNYGEIFNQIQKEVSDRKK